MTEAKFVRHLPWARLLILGALWLVVINQLRIEWTINPQYNFGWSVPVLCLYLLWERWKSRPEIESPYRTKWLKWMIGCLAFAFLFIRLIQEANPGWRLVSWAITLDVLGMTMCLLWLSWGWPVVRHFSFPIWLVLVAVPWPSVLENGFIQSMTRADTALAVEALSWFGLPALQRGNVIEIGTGLVGIDEACSGIRSFQATLMIAVFFGELYSFNWVRRFLLVVIGIGVAFILNVARTVLLVSIASQQGSVAIKRWHDPAGVTILLTCFTGLWLLALLWRKKPSATVGHLRLASPQLLTLSLSRRFLAGLAIWLVAAELFTQTWYLAHESSSRQGDSWTLRWPTDRPSFRDLEIPENTRAQLRFGEGRSGAWTESDGSEWQMFLFRWPKPVSHFDRVILHNALSHQPEICLPATGMTLQSDLGRKNIAVNDLSLSFRRLVFDSRGRTVHIFYCIWEEGQTSAGTRHKLDWAESNLWRAALTRLDAAWAGQRYQGMRVLEIAAWGYANGLEAEAALASQLERLLQLQSR
jgi:exosortase